MSKRQGPLTHLKIVEFAGIGPAPYGAMLLADLGAKIIRIDRPGGYPALADGLDLSSMDAAAVCNRSRDLIRLDLKSEQGRATVLRLVSQADAVIEAYRPGTMEKLGLGPDICLNANPKLAYVRMTGWGQTGPMSQMAGHDMNYLGLSGALSLFGRDGAATQGIPPLVGDMGGGAMFMVLGLLAAVMQARAGGAGQVVDAAIVDGSASLFALLSGLNAMGQQDYTAGENPLDGGRHFYRTYICADGEYVVVGAIEGAFRKTLLERLDLLLDPDLTRPTADNEAVCVAKLSGVFASHPRQHWVDRFQDTDGCVTPVLSVPEAATAPHNQARGVFETLNDVLQPAPAPRFSATPGAISASPIDANKHAPHALGGWGFTDQDIQALISGKVLEAAPTSEV
ncbi:CaiB/BaiF CoA transferase family protein [Halocynthiibacter namhaensis]|uniref:CaiB/BaiF CoA transferase family protein n=1 Tax=Halocynthiibacter namhaensis TaxID=1290553 RepID=UPI00192E67D5|nr:CaiB/BaiF CoA-transferase family protein [Halocynthiibacter namhaensis]